MSHPLTDSSIFATLITLGAVACGGSTPAPESPVGANEVPAATERLHRFRGRRATALGRYPVLSFHALGER